MKKIPWQKLFWLVLSWRLALLLLALVADHFLVYAPSFPYSKEILAKLTTGRWLYSWANFDGVHYLTIASKGYLETALIQAFFPVFPLMLSLLKAIFGQYFFIMALLSQFLLTWLLSGLFFYLLKVVLQKSSSISWWAVIILLIFPTSFFLGALYNESLFLIVVLASFIFAHHKQWWWAGIMGALASATRVVGIALWPALIVEWWLSKNKPLTMENITKEIKAGWGELVQLSISVLGLAGYMLYLHNTFADPLYFFHVQSEFGAGREEGLILLPQVIWRYLKILTTTPLDWKYFAYAQEFFFSIGFFGLLIWFWKRVKASYLIFALLVLIVPTLTGTFSSMPRYVLAAFPFYYLLADWLNNQPTRFLVLALSGLLLIINTLLFIQGYWVA
ncbi:MAG: hypothetical protein ACOZAK_02255 [Patescibacteria group bacterium]